MVLWGIIVGVLVGWTLDELFGGFGIGGILGGIAGFLAGITLRAAVRSEIREALARYAAEQEPVQQAGPSEQARAAEAVEIAEAIEELPEQFREEKAPEVRAEDVRPEPAPAPAPVRPPTPARPKAQAAPPQLVRDEVWQPAEPEEADAAASAEEETPWRPAAPPVSPADVWFEKARDWLLGGNTIVRAGLAILFIGLSFLVRFAAAAGWFPIEFRLAAVGAVGAGLVALGFNRRIAKPMFGLAVQGTGVAVLYLTVFAATRIYEILPPTVGFVLMVVFCALGCALALLQNSQAMAFASFFGGFAVPIMLGGDTETPLPLFTYGTILNVAILFIAWKRSWRSLNLLGFVATFGLATLWGVTSYEPQHYAICQGFLAASVVIYLATAILYAHNTPGRFGNFADGTLLFGPALAGFALEVGMVGRYEYGSAFAALGFAAVYIAFALVCLRKRREEMRVLIECMGAIGIGFVTLSIPLALEARWTSTTWALEGAGAFWVGKRQARWMQRAFGLLLQLVAVLVFLGTLEPSISSIPLLNAGFIGGLLVTLPILATAWWLREPLPHSGTALAKNYADAEFALRQLAFLGGFMLAAITLGTEVLRELPAAPGSYPMPFLATHMQPLTLMLALLALMTLFAWLGRRTQWTVATWPARASLFVLLVTFLIEIGSGRNVLYWPDVAFLAIGLALHLHLVHAADHALGDGPETLVRGWQRFIHAGTVWLATGMLANAIYLGIERGHLWDTSWAGVINLDSAAGVLFLLTVLCGPRRAGAPAPTRWPLRHYATSYYWIAAIPLAVLTGAGALATALFAQGVTDPLPYIPLVNPVDLSLGLALVVLLAWRRMLARVEPSPPDGGAVTGSNALAIVAIMLFIFVNTIWLRTAHHWMGVDWSPDALLASFEVQTGLAILWTVLAMALMITAHRKALRIVWLAGAALLVMVVIKLILVDLSNSGGWERVVAFIAVGALMLVIGYFAPLPPAFSDAEREEKSA